MTSIPEIPDSPESLGPLHDIAVRPGDDLFRTAENLRTEEGYAYAMLALAEHTRLGTLMHDHNEWALGAGKQVGSWEPVATINRFWLDKAVQINVVNPDEDVPMIAINNVGEGVFPLIRPSSNLVFAQPYEGYVNFAVWKRKVDTTEGTVMSERPLGIRMSRRLSGLIIGKIQ